MSLALQTLPSIALRETLKWALTQAHAPVVRPIERWVEEEVTLPAGPYVGERYRHHRHPASRPWFRALDSRLWSRHALTGPQQNGKSLMGYVAPVLWHLFEVGETVIIGLPSLDMANDKWAADFKPTIEASDFRDLMPKTGEGSKGGQVKRAITFRNGATLRFMTAGGGDKSVAGFTSRVVAVTETDGMDTPGEASREADRIEQLEGRTRAFGRLGKRIYLECTVSIERGRIWQELKHGTDSRLLRPCPHCGEFVAPEREHLRGWQDAASEGQAAARAHFVCPACDRPWTDQERHAAAEKVVLVHGGQTVDRDGTVTGEIPDTDTFSFRWSAIDNPFTSAADLGAEEWKAQHSTDRDNAEKKLRQFVWAIPHEPPDIDVTPLDPQAVADRKSGLKARDLPSDCVGVVIGIDTSKRRLHWTAKAVRPDGSLPVIEYGVQPVESERLGVFRGLLEALGKLREYFESWRMPPAQVWIDSGWHEHTDAVYEFCALANARTSGGRRAFSADQGLRRSTSQDRAIHRPGREDGRRRVHRPGVPHRPCQAQRQAAPWRLARPHQLRLLEERAAPADGDARGPARRRDAVD
jgi:phage terminase large subunit GpA-like protein